MMRIYGLVGLLMWALLGNAYGDVVKASEWIDRVVVTHDGELLGRVEDFAIDSSEVSVKYVVVAIGSFLIDDNLIAVAPDALQLSADGEYLVVYTEGLASARRFGPGNWPPTADVLAMQERGSPPSDVQVPQTAEDSRGFAEEGVATISDGRRTAVIRSGERSMSVEHEDSTPQAAVRVRDDTDVASGEPDPTKLPLPRFGALDSNDDGVLDRREIGARLARDERFSELDTDESGTIDSFEYDLFVESRN